MIESWKNKKLKIVGRVSEFYIFPKINIIIGDPKNSFTTNK